ncbi:MAG TPA: hypothetical protein PK431_04650 [Chitinophagales bacterium]|nr:hypothetical protein [Chitinophagales bacterium]
MFIKNNLIILFLFLFHFGESKNTSLNINKHKNIFVLVSSPKTANKIHLFHYRILIQLKNGNSFVVNANHIFLLPNGKWRRADRLTPFDCLLDEKFIPIKIKQISAGDYFNHAISNTDNDFIKLFNKYNNNIVNTFGVISGDSFIQSIQNSLNVGYKLPQVGSKSYNIKYKNLYKKFDSLIVTLKISNFENFTPYKLSVSIIDSLGNVNNKFQNVNLDETDKFILFDELKTIYEKSYSDIKIVPLWLDYSFNAWLSVSDKGTIYITGGLLRSQYIFKESLALIIAHEIGHKYGLSPSTADNISCEGQSDYVATNEIEPKVCKNDSDFIIKGIKQIENLYNIEASLNIFSRFHPDSVCRIATFYAGLRNEAKPQCSKDFDSKICIKR